MSMSNVQKIRAFTFVAALVATLSARAAGADEPADASVTRPCTEPKGPTRSGFTLGLAAGVGGDYVETPGGANANHVGISGFNLDLGGFVTPNLAILLKSTVSNFAVFDHSTFDLGNASTIGPAVQYWMSDHFNIAAGAGLALTTVRATGQMSEQDRYGAALMLGARYLPLAGVHNGFGLFADVEPILSSGGTLSISYQAGLGYQWY
jgi:hypothetical protein